VRLPHLKNPERYAGLYVVDFGDTTAVGYTAREVAMLLESGLYADARIYRIARAYPDGRMEMIGVSRAGLAAEGGLFFYRRTLDQARADYQQLLNLLQQQPLSCGVQLFLARLAPLAALDYVVALAYANEFDEQVSRWMLDHSVAAGETADGGPGRLKAIRQQAEILESVELDSPQAIKPRTREELLAAVDQPIQRKL
jgi:pimeloyl-ACP methyl ester carboxylesterase